MGSTPIDQLVASQPEATIIKPDAGAESLGAVSVAEEFASLNLGDSRLNRRAQKIAKAMANQPTASLPVAMGTETELEGCYRLLSNQLVTAQALLTPHLEQTRQRCRQRTVLAIADTTSMQFDGEDTRLGLGPTTQGGKGHGFRFHPTLAVSFTDKPTDILGVLSSHVWVRNADVPSADKLFKQGKITRAEARARRAEEFRWWNNVHQVEQQKFEDVELIHVQDREADSYEYIARMLGENYRFILRMQSDKRALDMAHDAQQTKLRALADNFEVICQREVDLSVRPKKKHKQPARQARRATLSIGAAEVRIVRPPGLKNPIPETVTLNAVRTWEESPPDGEDPVEWFLLTTEPIGSAEEVTTVVDMYRARWLIEEFFCAIKTGCVYETRQLESLDTLEKALAFTLPIAWQLLRLKMLARTNASDPARCVLTPEQLHVLRHSAERPLANDPTIDEAMMAIARLGGHLKRNGNPGWRILARGYLDLTRRVLGFRVPRPPQDHNSRVRRCDLS